MQIARVQTKLSEYNKAIETYRLIESEYGEIIIDKRIHLGIMFQPQTYTDLFRLADSAKRKLSLLLSPQGKRLCGSVANYLQNQDKYSVPYS